MDDQTVNELVNETADQDNAELHDIDLNDTPTVESIESFVPTVETETPAQAQASPTLVVGKFRKKPVEIEAIQFTAYNVPEVREFLGDAATWTYHQLINNGRDKIQIGENDDVPREEVISTAEIATLEGHLVATSHDGLWIIKGVEGEFYPCKDSIFQATYEEVPDETA